MLLCVIDTNVPIAANGTDRSICAKCRVATINFLVEAIRSGKIYLDSKGEIQEEYRRHLNPRGQPGVGDRFFLEVLNSHPDRVVRVDLPMRSDGQYQDLPQAVIDSGFDPSDRKFAALAHKKNAKVYNAVDTDWLEKKDVLNHNGISIEFLCGCDPTNWRKTD